MNEAEFAKIIEGKSLNDITALTKELMMYILDNAVAVSTLAALYPQAKEIVRQIAPIQDPLANHFTASMGLIYGA